MVSLPPAEVEAVPSLVGGEAALLAHPEILHDNTDDDDDYGDYDDDDIDRETNGDDGDLHLQRSFSRDPRTSSEGRKLDNDDARCCDRRLRHRRDPALCDRSAPHYLLEVIF